MEFLTDDAFTMPANHGVASTQLLSPHNSRSRRVTLAQVVVQPGHEQPRFFKKIS